MDSKARHFCQKCKADIPPEQQQGKMDCFLVAEHGLWIYMYVALNSFCWFDGLSKASQ